MTIDRRAGALALSALLAALGACGGADGKPATAPAEPVATLITPARLADAVMRDGVRYLPLRIRLAGGGAWVTESCNPVAPVFAGRVVPRRSCLTNFWSREVLTGGAGELAFDWPLDAPDRKAAAGDRIELAVSLATDCEKSGGPGLFAMGDCRTVRAVRASATLEP